MEFGLLGPLTVRSGDTAVAVQRGKERAVLAVLLLAANRVVAVEEITETLWGPQAPTSAAVTVRNYVKRLRQVLGETGRERISTRQHGYMITAAEDELDLARFEGLLASARASAQVGSWDQAADDARSALALWRGEPLADVDCDVLAMREVPRLAELRLQAQEVGINADLRLGRHADVLPEAQRLAAAQPLREHLHALLMLALYRSGRQAEALAAYQHARSVLVEELGIEPGTELRTLHQQILAADPAIDLPENTTLNGASGAVGGLGAGETAEARGADRSGAASLASETRRERPPVPRQLPATPAHFAGRAAELAALDQMLDGPGSGLPGTVVISAIGGTAGVGKTALALRFAHQVADRFADGQLYVNLRGFDPEAPVTPAEAIHGFLEALGVPADRIPPSQSARESLYRSLLADRQMLIVLDNARDEQQLRPLLPATPASLVIVTSRSQLSGLAAAEGASPLTLDVLARSDATQMLAARIGPRAAAEPAALVKIAAQCSCLPLALAVAAARAAARPGFSLTTLADELGDTARRLDVLDSGDPAASVRAVFSWSFQQLSPPATRMFRLLGLHAGPDITAAAAASLAAIGEPEARRLLNELTRAHLITEHVPRRYTFHDLLRAYAADQACTTDTYADMQEAVGRVLDYYLHTARSGAILINRSLDPIVLPSPRPGVAQEQLADHTQALAWFKAEHQVLLAAITLADSTGFDSHTWQIPSTMGDFLNRRGQWNQKATILRIAVAAAARQGDSAGQAVCHRILGNACSRLGHYDQAASHYAAGLRLCQQLGDRLGEAHAQGFLGMTAEAQGRCADALAHSEQALRLFQAVGHRPGEAYALKNVGWHCALLGDYQQARIFCQWALSLAAELGLRDVESYAWDCLGYAEHHLGNLAESASCYRRALPLIREFGDRPQEADILIHLGDTHQAAGELSEARDAWRQSLDILDDLQHPDADKVRARLAASGPGVKPGGGLRSRVR